MNQISNFYKRFICFKLKNAIFHVLLFVLIYNLKVFIREPYESNVFREIPTQLLIHILPLSNLTKAIIQRKIPIHQTQRPSDYCRSLTYDKFQMNWNCLYLTLSPAPSANSQKSDQTNILGRHFIHSSLLSHFAKMNRQKKSFEKSKPKVNAPTNFAVFFFCCCKNRQRIGRKKNTIFRVELHNDEKFLHTPTSENCFSFRVRLFRLSRA